MILLKVRFPFFIFLLFTGVFFCSCTRKTSDITAVKEVTVYEKYITTAEDFYTKGVYDSAYYYYNQIRTQSSAKEDAEKIVYALLKMVAIQQTHGDYVGSEVTATEAVSYFKNKIENQYKVAIYNSLGINYKNLYDYPNAIKYYKKASALADTPLQKEIMQNNIAVVNMEQQNYKQAIQSLELLSKTPIAKVNLEHLARVLGNLGYCYYKVGDNRSGAVLQRALKIRQQLHFDYGLITSFSNLAEYYQRSQPQLAVKYAQESYNKATALKSIDDRLLALALLMEISPAPQVRTYTKKYLQLNDSIRKVRQIAKNQFAKIKYDATHAQNENLQLKADNAEKALALEQEKIRNYLLCFVILLGVILAFILYFYLKDKNKKEKQAAIYESEIRISKKLHDELANDVYQTIAFAETQDLQNAIQKETLLDSLDKIYSRTRNISRENSPIPTGETYEIELKEMLSSFNAAHLQIILKNSSSISWNKIADEKKIALYRVLQELMINMKKHSQATFVVLRFETYNKHCYIYYSDNGIGIKTTLQSKNGLLNVENRIQAIRGSIIFDLKSSKGLKIKLTFPK